MTLLTQKHSNKNIKKRLSTIKRYEQELLQYRLLNYADVLQNDIHHLTLIVKQTLKFTLNIKTSDMRSDKLLKKEFKAKVINLLQKIFNIEHTLNIIVGKQFL